MVMDKNLLFEIKKIKKIMDIGRPSFYKLLLFEDNNLKNQNFKIEFLISENEDEDIEINLYSPSQLTNMIKNRWGGSKCMLYINTDKGSKCKYEITDLNPTTHFLDRTYRTKNDDNYKYGGRNYDPNIVDPEPLEGIDLILYCLEYLGQKIKNFYSQKGRPSHGQLNIHFKNNNDYTIATYVNLLSKKNVEKYKLTLTTQIKGVPLISNEKPDMVITQYAAHKYYNEK